MWILAAIVLILVAVSVYDLTQRKHAILRNFPILGHFRYLFEAVGPELRQYIVTSNNEERPFTRDQRAWIYASSKLPEQQYRLRHRRGDGTVAELHDHQARGFSNDPAQPWRARLRWDPRDPRSESVGAGPAAAEGVSSDFDRQRIGNELRFTERASGGSAQPRLPPSWVPAEHGRGRNLPLPSTRWGIDLADRYGLFRLPGRRWPVLDGALQGATRDRARTGHRNQDQPRRKTRSGRAVAWSQGVARNSCNPGHTCRQDVHQSGAA